MIQNIFHLMVDYNAACHGTPHDISHLTKVWTYSRHIGLSERLPESIQQTLEAAAIVHDIACPILRNRQGNTNWQDQELEGPALARTLLQNSGLREEQLERVCYLVGHHHTLTLPREQDYQILIEADYLVNAEEKGLNAEAISSFCTEHFRTAEGIFMARNMFHF